MNTAFQDTVATTETITEHEKKQIARANATKKQPVGWRVVADKAFAFVRRFVN